MRISGSGRLSEGKINDEINLSGSAKIAGDFECMGFKSSGSLRGEGNLTVHGNVKSSGSFRIAGSLHGDGNAKFSGSSSVGGEVLIKGVLGGSGSFRAGDKVEAIEGFRLRGSARVEGDLLSQKLIDIEGSMLIDGNIKGDDVFIGTHLKRERKISKKPFKVHGNIFATNTADITGALVNGDVRGRDVKIGKGTEVAGVIYYVDNIEVHQRTTLANEPIQIQLNEE